MKNKQLLEQGLMQLGISLESSAIERFAEFTGLLLDYNEKVNLTAVTQEEEIIQKHYLDSASLLTLPHIFPAGAKVIDIGCGAGFPSFPLRFLRDDLKISLLDSLKKRVLFQEMVCQTLSLSGVMCIHGRAEEFGRKPEFRQTYDVAVTRAVAHMNVISEYCLPFVRVGGYFVAMKGPDVEEELKASEKAIELLGGKLERVQKVKIPQTDIVHTLIMIKKRSDTSSKYPRNSGKIKKSPL